MPEDIYDFSNDPTDKDIDKCLSKISVRIRDGKKKQPVENFLVICLFAGHGVLKEGMQTMLYNQYNPKTGFYKFMNAEKKLRGWAYIYPNSYIVGIFACCR